MKKAKAPVVSYPSWDWKPIRVYLEDEAPTIGSGWRRLLVKSKGGKVWIKCPYTLARKTLTFKEWEVIDRAV